MEKLELTEKNKELLGKIEEAREQGAKKRAEELADDALTRTLIVYWFIAILIVLGFLLCGYVLIMKLSKDELSWLPETYEKVSIAIDILAEALIGVVGFVIFSKGLCGLDKNTVRDRLIEKYSK